MRANDIVRARTREVNEVQGGVLVKVDSAVTGHGTCISEATPRRSHVVGINILQKQCTGLLLATK